MSYAYIPFDEKCSVVICNRGDGTSFIQVRDPKAGTVACCDLTLQHYRAMGYHGALLYREATGESALPRDMSIEGEPTELEVAERETPATPTPVRVRTRPVVEAVASPVRVRTRTRA